MMEGVVNKPDKQNLDLKININIVIFTLLNI